MILEYIFLQGSLNQVLVAHTCNPNYFVPVILTTWEIEIRKITVLGQMGQKSL
jgi:ABC-type phosphate/phosphonate transport system permease subunit